MRIFELNAAEWKTILEFYHALLTAIGAPDGHGKSIDAAIDSMVWGGVNAVSPPYKIRIIKAKATPKAVFDEIELLARCLEKARADSISLRKQNVDVKLEIMN